MAECHKCRLRMVLHNMEDSCLYREFDELKRAKLGFETICKKMENSYEGRLLSTRVFLRQSELHPGQMERVRRCLYIIRVKYLGSHQTALVELVEPAVRCLVSMEISPK